MSGESGRSGSGRAWFLPALVAAAGVAVLAWFARQGLLKPVRLGVAGWCGIAVMAVGLLVVALAGRIARRLPERLRNGAMIKLAGTFLCGIGAMLVIGV